MNIKVAYDENDYEAIKVLNDFLPDKIFDSHMHLFDGDFLPNIKLLMEDGTVCEIEDYKREMKTVLCNPKVLRVNNFAFPDPCMSDLHSESYKKSDEFLVKQLSKDPLSVGEIMVSPEESIDDIEKRLVHPRIRGLKCYHQFGKGKDTFQSSIEEYLPEAAWEVANKRKMGITLHMVKNEALSDEDNLKYIKSMAQKYPDAVLVLAHAARSFAAWTAIETVSEVSHLDNVWFDFSAVCEPSAMFQIMKKAGVERCMWGSDYPVCCPKGKCISLGDSFHWLYKQELDGCTNSNIPIRFWTLATENLMATRLACIMAELHESQIEDLFYNNAARLFDRT